MCKRGEVALGGGVRLMGGGRTSHRQAFGYRAGGQAGERAANFLPIWPCSEADWGLLSKSGSLQLAKSIKPESKRAKTRIARPTVLYEWHETTKESQCLAGGCLSS